MKQGKCPYCKKWDWVPEVVEIHTEAYGSGVKNFHCVHCNKVVKAYARVEVIIESATPTTDASDWSDGV